MSLYREPEYDTYYINNVETKIENVELYTAKVTRYVKAGISIDLAWELAEYTTSRLFNNLIKKYTKINPIFIAETLVSAEPQIRRKYQIPERTKIEWSEEDWNCIFHNLNEGLITKDSIIPILSSKERITDAIKNFMVLDDQTLLNKIKEVKANNPTLEGEKLFGVCMKELRGRAQVEKVKELLK